MVAVRDEIESIPVFVESLRKLPLPPSVELRMIFVEDSSSDGTLDLLRRFSAEDQAIAHYSLVRGYGQGPAIAFGLRQARTDAMIMMDVDGGHAVSIIPEMVSRWLAGAHVVQAVRTSPHVPTWRWYRRWGTVCFNLVMDGLTGLHTARQNVYFRLVRKEVVEELLADRRWPHFLRIRFGERPGWRIEYVEFEAADRVLGESKYHLRRLAKLAVKAYFSTVSPRRFALQALGFAVLVVTLAWRGNPWVAGAAAALLVAMVVTFFRISGVDPLRQLAVRDSSAGASGAVPDDRQRR